MTTGSRGAPSVEVDWSRVEVYGPPLYAASATLRRLRVQARAQLHGHSWFGEPLDLAAAELHVLWAGLTALKREELADEQAAELHSLLARLLPDAVAAFELVCEYQRRCYVGLVVKFEEKIREHGLAWADDRRWRCLRGSSRRALLEASARVVATVGGGVVRVEARSREQRPREHRGGRTRPGSKRRRSRARPPADDGDPPDLDRGAAAW